MEDATMKLRVITLCDVWSSSKGGLSTFNRELTIHLAKHSHLDVYCYLPEFSDSDKKAAVEKNVTLVRAKDIPGNRDPFLKLVRLPTQLSDPDVIISHGRKFGCLAFLIKERFPNCKWIHFVHVNLEEMGKYKRGNNEIKVSNEKDSDEVSCCRSADVVVAVGPQLWDKYTRSLSMDEKNVQKFYPGLSEEFLHLSLKKYDSAEFHVYIFCRCSSEDFELKGVDVLANAVKKLGKKYKVHVVGVKENEEENTFQLILEESEIAKNQLYVREYCNDREELKSMFCQADLVVMPSRAEAFGLIGLEALSAGVPLLVSAASGLGISLKELTFGEICVVESDDHQEWKDKIESVKGKKRSQRYEQMELLKKHYDEEYKWEQQCSILAGLF